MAGIAAETCSQWHLTSIKQEVTEESDNSLLEGEVSHDCRETNRQLISNSQSTFIDTSIRIKEEGTLSTVPVSKIKKEEDESLLSFPAKVYPCIQCSESFPKPIRLAAHVRLCHTRPFSCSKCNKSFYHEVSCDQHMKTHDLTEKPYKCNMCSRAFIMKIHLDEHLRTHYGNKPFSCNKCGKSFRNYVLCKQHMKVHEEGYECVTCEVCFKKLRKPSSLAAHLARHAQQKEHTCSECGKVFSAARLLTAHRRTHAKPFACNVCDRRFTARHALNKHIANHSDPKMLFCVHCCKAFSLQRSLTVHLKTHIKEFPFLCRSCGKGFSQERELYTHRLSSCCKDHHFCVTCGRSFKSPWGLARHAVVHTDAHKKTVKKSDTSSKQRVVADGECIQGASKNICRKVGESSSASKKRVEGLPSNVRVCGHCYCVFTNSSAFTKHVLQHWRMSKTSCFSCLKRFSSSRILSQHYASHARVHKCPHCSVTFTRIPMLTKHVRSHNFGKKLKRRVTLKCRKCGKICKDYRSYVTHVRILCYFARAVKISKIENPIKKKEVVTDPNLKKEVVTDPN